MSDLNGQLISTPTGQIAQSVSIVGSLANFGIAINSAVVLAGASAVFTVPNTLGFKKLTVFVKGDNALANSIFVYGSNDGVTFFSGNPIASVASSILYKRVACDINDQFVQISVKNDGVSNQTISAWYVMQA